MVRLSCSKAHAVLARLEAMTLRPHSDDAQLAIGGRTATAVALEGCSRAASFEEFT